MTKLKYNNKYINYLCKNLIYFLFKFKSNSNLLNQNNSFMQFNFIIASLNIFRSIRVIINF